MHTFSACTKGNSPQKKTGQNHRSKDLKEEKPGKTSGGTEGGRMMRKDNAILLPTDYPPR
jgi:hypothetical protein